MSEIQSLIEQAYEAAKAGAWDRLLSEWANSDLIAKRCSRYANPGSSWTFLHQAAYFNHAQACRELIQRGASAEALTHDLRTPADVADQRGHRELAALLRDVSPGRDSLWSAPIDPDVLPSSNRWHEAAQAVAGAELLVAYAGGLVRIPTGASYFQDAYGRVLVGWHGTVNPPLDMDGVSLISRLKGR